MWYIRIFLTVAKKHMLFHALLSSLDTLTIPEGLVFIVFGGAGLLSFFKNNKPHNTYPGNLSDYLQALSNHYQFKYHVSNTTKDKIS